MRELSSERCRCKGEDGDAAGRVVEGLWYAKQTGGFPTFKLSVSYLVIYERGSFYIQNN